MKTIAAAVRGAGPPPPTPPRHASHGGRGDERPVLRSSEHAGHDTTEKSSRVELRVREPQALPRVSPPHASEASGGGGGGAPAHATGGGGASPPPRPRG